MKKLLLILLVFLVSCGSVKKTTVIETNTETSSTEVKQDSVSIKEVMVLHDTTIKYLADSTSLEMLFECDSNNNVLMRQVEELESGNRIHQDYSFKDGQLKVNNKTKEDSLKLYWKDYYYSEYVKQNQIRADTVYITKETSKKVKKGNFFSTFKWIIIAFIVGLVIGWTKNLWLKLIRGF